MLNIITFIGSVVINLVIATLVAIGGLVLLGLITIIRLPLLLIRRNNQAHSDYTVDAYESSKQLA